MIYIHRTETDPFFNIATEEYVLKNFSEDVMMLWQSKPSVVVGKHQNVVAEVNLSYAREKEIQVIRRISGGGTVYHDLGNLNYTVIRTEENRERLIDFGKFSEPVVNFLKILGIQADSEGKNNLTVNGKKISGNSAHVFKNRVMHHGTLLYSTNLDILEKVITPAKVTIEDKSVKSIKAMVTNLVDVLHSDLPVSVFKQKLIDFLLNFHQVDKIYHFSEKDTQNIKALVGEKYNTANWNFGYSPAYTFKNKLKSNELSTRVKNGFIEQLSLKTDFTVSTKKFIGVMHRYEDVLKVVSAQEYDSEKQQLLLNLFGF